jgi:hypothetical protein
VGKTVTDLLNKREWDEKKQALEGISTNCSVSRKKQNIRNVANCKIVMFSDVLVL